VRREYPNLHAGLFSSVADQTIRAFAGYGWAGGYDKCGDIPTAVTAAVYQSGLDELRTHAMGIGPGFGSYYISGSSHTILRSGSFYTTKIGTTTIPQWMESTIAGTSGNLGP
jgi:hypothetical protein